MGSTALAVASPHSLALDDLIEAAGEYASAARAGATLRAYECDFRVYEGFCRAHGLAAVPAQPSTLILYLTSRARAGTKPSTLQRALSAISFKHTCAGHASPVDQSVRTLMRGIRNKLGTAPASRAALTAEALERVVSTLPHSLIGTRDRALLLLGFASAMRRSELVALRVEDLEFGPARVSRSRFAGRRPTRTASRSAWASAPRRHRCVRCARFGNGSMRPASPRASFFGRSIGTRTSRSGCLRRRSRRSLSGHATRRTSTPLEWLGTPCGEGWRHPRLVQACLRPRSGAAAAGHPAKCLTATSKRAPSSRKILPTSSCGIRERPNG